MEALKLEISIARARIASKQVHILKQKLTVQAWGDVFVQLQSLKQAHVVARAVNLMLKFLGLQMHVQV
jgi:hypothetical protein